VQRETRDLATSVTEIANSAADEVRAGADVLHSETTTAIGAAQSATPATATVVRPASSNGSPAASSAATPAPPKAKPKTKPAKKAVPTKADPLADLGGFDEP